jgi:uncharacterized membrane protein YbhN (UPF0104 family)
MGQTVTTRLTQALGRLRGPRGRAARAAVTIAGVAAVVVCLLQMGSSLPRLDQLGHPNALWLTVAILVEVASLVAYALIVREVLAMWHVHEQLPALLRATVGGIAIGTTLPVGQALSLTYWYRQLRSAGANPRLAAFALLAAGVAGAVSLALLLLVGVAVAGNSGPLVGERLPLLATGAVLLVLGVVFRRRVGDCVRALLGRHGLPRPDDDSDGRRRLIKIGALACLNWLLDCASLFAALLAVGAAVPVHGVLVTYALAQIVNQLPLPLVGGGGTVELSLSLGFSAFGHTTGEVLAGILLFRLISCWALVPLGWLMVGFDNQRVARRRATRLHRCAPLDAEALPVRA